MQVWGRNTQTRTTVCSLRSRGRMCRGATTSRAYCAGVIVAIVNLL